MRESTMKENERKWSLHGEELLAIAIRYFKEVQNLKDSARNEENRFCLDFFQGDFDELEEIEFSCEKGENGKEKNVESSPVPLEGSSDLFISPLLIAKEIQSDFSNFSLDDCVGNNIKQLENQILVSIIEKMKETQKFKEEVLNILKKNDNSESVQNEAIDRLAKFIIFQSLAYFNSFPANEKIISPDLMPSLNFGSLLKNLSPTNFNIDKNCKKSVQKPLTECTTSFISKKELTKGFRCSFSKASKTFAKILVEIYDVMFSFGFKYTKLTEEDFYNELNLHRPEKSLKQVSGSSDSKKNFSLFDTHKRSPCSNQNSYNRDAFKNHLENSYQNNNEIHTRRKDYIHNTTNEKCCPFSLSQTSANYLDQEPRASSPISSNKNNTSFSVPSYLRKYPVISKAVNISFGGNKPSYRPSQQVTQYISSLCDSSLYSPCYTPRSPGVSLSVQKQPHLPVSHTSSLSLNLSSESQLKPCKRQSPVKISTKSQLNRAIVYPNASFPGPPSTKPPAPTVEKFSPNQSDGGNISGGNVCQIHHSHLTTVEGYQPHSVASKSFSVGKTASGSVEGITRKRLKSPISHPSEPTMLSSFIEQQRAGLNFCSGRDEIENFKNNRKAHGSAGDEEKNEADFCGFNRLGPQNEYCLDSFETANNKTTSKPFVANKTIMKGEENFCGRLVPTTNQNQTRLRNGVVVAAEKFLDQFEMTRTSASHFEHKFTAGAVRNSYSVPPPPPMSAKI